MKTETLNRKLSPIEGSYLFAPYAIVSLAARVRGKITPEALRIAVEKVQTRHPNLQRRIVKDKDGIPWFQGDPTREIPIKIYSRESEESWIKAVEEENLVPFNFDQAPAIRFLLIRGSQLSELVIYCHHTICDGLSLAFLARDLLRALGNPDDVIKILEDTQPIDQDHLPPGVKINPIVNFAIKRINQKWEEDQIIFDQEDYQALAKGYWANADHKIQIVDFNREQTATLVSICKKAGVTVNSSLAAALKMAQIEVQGANAFHNQFAIAGSFRERLAYPVGEGMGIFAGAITLKNKFKPGIEFWEYVRRFHNKVTPLYTNQQLFSDLLAWCYLAPGVIESLSFKLAGGSVRPESAQFQRLHDFAKREDLISAMVKREKMDSPDSILIGTALTNLTRLDFQESYGDLLLERMVLKPGGAFPLAFVNMLVGAVTCAGRLSLSLEFSARRITPTEIELIRQKVVDLLLNS